MNIPELITKIQQFHSGQYRLNTKQPYHIHPLTVYNHVKTYFSHRNDQTHLEKIALLHDTLEDTWVTETYLQKKLSNAVITSVKAISKPQNITYEEYLEQVANNEKATLIKLLDILDNSKDLTQFPKKEQDRRKTKIQQALSTLPTPDKSADEVKKQIRLNADL